MTTVERASEAREVFGSVAGGPGWLLALRERALERFEAAGMPTRKDEEFKYTPLTDLAGISLRPLAAGQAGDSRFATLGTARFVIANGLVAGGGSELDEGLLGKIASLDGKLGSSNDGRFCDLNTALFSDCCVVRASRGSESAPIWIRHVALGEGGSCYPRVLISVEDGAEATVIETFEGSDGAYFTNSVTEIRLGERAAVRHERIQAEGSRGIHVATLAVHQEGQSNYTGNNWCFGGRVARTDVNVYLAGSHTETRLNGVYVGTGQQLIDNHTRVDHAEPDGRSFEVYKGILADKARGVFNGKIFVYQDAQRTDAKQTNQAVLLGPNAGVDSKPQLEIFADDVKCTHGATVGALSEEALFYLRSRGIREAEARGLLIRAFAAGAFEQISVDAVREAVEELLSAKLAQAGRRSG